MSGSKIPASQQGGKAGIPGAIASEILNQKKYEAETGEKRPQFSGNPDKGYTPRPGFRESQKDWNADYLQWRENNPPPDPSGLTVNTPRGSFQLGGGNSSGASSASSVPAHPATVTQNIPGATTPQVVRWEDTAEGRKAAAEKQAKLDADQRKLDRMRAGREDTLLTTSDGVAETPGVQTKKLLGQ